MVSESIQYLPQEFQVSCSNQIISSKGDLLCTYYLPKHSDKVTELIAKGMMLVFIPQRSSDIAD